MASLTSPIVTVLNLGSFSIKPWALELVIKMEKGYMAKRDVPTTFERMRGYQNRMDKIAVLENLHKDILDEKQRGLKIKMTRYAKQHNKDLEK